MPAKPLPYRRPPGVAEPLVDADQPQPLTPGFAKPYVIVFVALLLLLPLLGAGGLTRSLLAKLGHGNTSVFMARDGWLFDQNDIKAITGMGPLANEKPSPLHLPKLPGNTTSKTAILDFAQQLKQRGVPLLIVVVPTKVMLYPERITNDEVEDSAAPLYHPDEAELVDQLVKAGIDVQDLTEGMMAMKQQPLKFKYPIFLPTDKHWTPETMQGFAKSIALHIRSHYPAAAGARPMETGAQVHDEHSFGDQVQRLHLSHPGWVFAPENVGLVTLAGTENDPVAPLTLLGGSLVNIFDDPSLGYAPEGTTARQGAGFAQHLSFYLGHRIDTLAINGGGITAVRQELAKRFDDDIRAKKLVVWLLSADDLLSESTETERWEKVTLNTTKKPAEVLTPMLTAPRSL